MAVASLQFSTNTDLVMACHITGVHDVNRNTTLPDNNYELVKEWADSVTAAKLKGIIFHNNFTKELCRSFQNEFISFVDISYDAQFNPNVFRYFVYRDFLQQHIDQIKGVFITDVSDVVLVKNPFIEPLYMDNPTTLFCGDEPKIVHNDWMLAHSEHLRNNIPDYEAYESDYAQETLLNCGVIGGHSTLFLDFLIQLCAVHQAGNRHNKTPYTGDMGAFNYLIRTQFNDRIIYGSPVNTVFKGYETERTDCWFRHK